MSSLPSGSVLVRHLNTGDQAITQMVGLFELPAMFTSDCKYPVIIGLRGQFVHLVLSQDPVTLPPPAGMVAPADDLMIEDMLSEHFWLDAIPAPGVTQALMHVRRVLIPASQPDSAIFIAVSAFRSNASLAIPNGYRTDVMAGRLLEPEPFPDADGLTFDCALTRPFYRAPRGTARVGLPYAALSRRRIASGGASASGTDWEKIADLLINPDVAAIAARFPLLEEVGYSDLVKSLDRIALPENRWVSATDHADYLAKVEAAFASQFARSAPG